VTVDVTTGAATLVGSFGLDHATLADVAFDPATGVLYGWSSGHNGSLYTVDLATGAATLVGASGLTLGGGNGLEFLPEGTLYLAGDGTQGVLRTIDKATGLSTGAVQLTGYDTSENIAALTFDGTSLLGVTNRSQTLIRIDPASGVITTIGPATIQMEDECAPGIDGLAALVPPPTTTTTTSTSTTTTSTTTTTTTTTATTTSATTATTTTVTTTTVTTTTAPAGTEVCGNCIDDDGDGLTDFEDPACCAGGETTMSLRHAKLTPRQSGTFMMLDATIPPPVPDDLGTADVFVELRTPADRTPLLCARIPAADLAVKKKLVAFRDRKHTVGSAELVEGLELRQVRGKGLFLHVQSRELGFQTPAAGPLLLTVAFRKPGAALANRCVGLTEPVRVVGRKSGLIFP